MIIKINLKKILPYAAYHYLRAKTILTNYVSGQNDYS